METTELNVFTNKTKTVCTCSSISIFLIVMFIISPLSNYVITSTIMRLIIIVLLGYTIYLNIEQTDYLRKVFESAASTDISNQLSINIICSYTFTLFIGLLIIFVVKSFF